MAALSLSSSFCANDRIHRPSKQQDRALLFKQFDPWLQRLMRRYRMSAEAREDALGDLYCRFCHLLDIYDPSRNIPLEPYLYRQLGAQLYSIARSGWRRSKRELPYYSEESADHDSRLGGDPTPEWNDGLVTGQVRSLLPAAFLQISSRQRRVLVLRYYGDLPYEEIAQRMDIRPATARSLARNALNSLREWMRKRRVAWE